MPECGRGPTGVAVGDWVTLGAPRTARRTRVDMPFRGGEPVPRLVFPKLRPKADDDHTARRWRVRLKSGRSRLRAGVRPLTCPGRLMPPRSDKTTYSNWLELLAPGLGRTLFFVSVFPATPRSRLSTDARATSKPNRARSSSISERARGSSRWFHQARRGESSPSSPTRPWCTPRVRDLRFVEEILRRASRAGRIGSPS